MMQPGFERILGSLAGTLVDFSRRHPWAVVIACVALTAGAAFQTATRLAVDTNPDLMTSPDLRYRQTNAELLSAFPDLQGNLVVLIDADDAEDARAAAEDLAAELRSDPTHFRSVFLPGDDPFYDDFGLFYVDHDELGRMAARIDKSGRLLATLAERGELPILIGALNHVISSEDGLSSLGDDGEKILDRVTEAVEAYNVGSSAPIEWDELLFEDVVPMPSNPQILMVQPDSDLTQMDPALEAIARVRAVAAGVEQRPGLRIRVTGDRAVHTEEMSLVLSEAVVAGALSLLLVTAILFYTLTSFRLLIATVLTLLIGLVWTAGFAATAVGHLNVLTTAFAVLYIGLGVDFGIHFALGYLEQRGLGEPLNDALHATGIQTGSSLVFCALTTAIGFYAFIPTSYTGVAELGIISGSGVFLSLLATLTWYPALIGLGLGESKKLSESPLGRLRIQLPGFPLVYPKQVLWVSAVLTAVFCVSAWYVRFDMDPLNVRDPRVESVQAMKDLLSDSDISAWTIEVLANDLEEARALSTNLSALPEVHQVFTVESFLPEQQAESLEYFSDMRASLTTPVELSEDESGEGRDPIVALQWTIEGYGVALDIDSELRGDESGGPLVEKAERLRGALEVLDARTRESGPPPDVSRLEADVFGDLPDLVEGVTDSLPNREVVLGDLPASLADRYLTPDGRARVEVFPSANLHERGELENFTDAIQSVRADAGGAVISTVELGRAIVDSLRQALITAVCVIVLLLLILWRSAKYMLITMTPLFIGAVATAAVTVLADVPFNFANVIVLPLILGIGVDSGIHLVHRHRIGLLGADDLLHTATARAVLFSALTTLVSFSTLALSNHLGIASLARLLVIGITLMLVANVVVLPAVLVIFDSKKKTSEADPDPQ